MNIFFGKVLSVHSCSFHGPCFLEREHWRQSKIIGSSILNYHSKQLFISFIGKEPTMWPANNCLQIIVCSCTMLSNCVWLQIIFCPCVKETVLFSFLQSLLRENKRSLCFPRIYIKNLKQTRWSNDKTIIIELGYRKISWFVSSVSRRSINSWSACYRQITIFCSNSSNNCSKLLSKDRQQWPICAK